MTRIAIKIRPKLVAVVFMVASVVVIGALYFSKSNNQVNPSSASIHQKRDAKVNSTNLATKDYVSYQYSLLNYAESDIATKQYGSANKYLHTIVENVPQHKVVANVYIDLADVANKTGDTSGYKKYTNMAINRLRDEGRNSAADKLKSDISRVK